MGKKIIIIGPPNAGKTTLRKIFFEGENSTSLLENSLEPTHGMESIILKLREEIGIFDLAGQENQYWFEINKNSIFIDSEIVIIVIDISSPLEDIVSFTNTVLTIRNELTPTSIVYLLLHKIDLIDSKKLIDLKIEVDKEFFKESLLKISSTSIKKEYIQKTFGLFIDILKTCITKKVVTDTIDLNFFRDTIYFLHKLQESSPISKLDLQDKLKYSNQNIDRITDVLESNNYIEISKVNNSEMISISDNGVSYINKTLKKFALEELFKIEGDYIEPVTEKSEKKHPFLGFIISDKYGKTMVLSEVSHGTLDSLLVKKFQQDTLDHELIPLFISALEQFSEEINIKNLSGFTLKGTNVKIQTFKFEKATFTLFMNSDTNIKSMKSYIQDWFTNFIVQNKKEIEECIVGGDITEISKLDVECNEWLDELNKKYKVMAINSDIFDIKQVKELYQKLEQLSEDKNLSSQKFVKKINNLKTKLIRASLDEDFNKIRDISKKIYTLHL